MQCISKFINKYVAKWSNRHVKMSDKEMKKHIEKILNHEDQCLQELKDKVKAYDEKIASLKSFGIYLEIELEQTNSSLHGPSKLYDLRKTKKLPMYYSSKIFINACKDDVVLTYQSSYSKKVRNVCCTFFPLVNCRQDEMEIIKEPFRRFDENMKNLFDKISRYCEKTNHLQ